MRSPFRLILLTALLTVAFQVGVARTASAHHVNLNASAVCDPTTGAATISFTATTWIFSSPSGDHPQVDIRFNNVTVTSGSFSAGAYSFSGTLPAPAGTAAGDVVVVSAVTVGPWGDGFEGGQSASESVVIPADCAEPGLGRFTGGGHQIRVDNVRVTRGLTIHCDLLLSNNLEINWQGNSFHMLEHLTTVACTDDPNIIQAPPDAPLDTLIGIGEGRYNNQEGYSIWFKLVDAGEPGRNDEMAIHVYETANPGNVILDVPQQVLTGGNLQAHYDQPHK